MRRSSLRRLAPLRSGSILRRAEPIPKRSTKNQAREREYREFRLVTLEARHACEIGPILWRAGEPEAHHCQGSASELHHVRKRSRGGGLCASTNVMAVCHSCHGWTEREPAKASELGILRASWST